MEENLVQFTYDGIPPLPEHPSETTPPGTQFPVPNTAVQFDDPRMKPADGYPLFELVAKRRDKNGKVTYENIEYVSILTPGDPKAIPRQKVTDTIRRKYARYYQLWKQGLQTSPVGTPLELWPILTPAQIHELKAINIFTVEQLCDVADANLHRIPMGETIRNQARDWMEAKKEADVLARKTAENDALRDGQKMLEDQLASQSEEIKALTAQLAALSMNSKENTGKGSSKKE